MVVCVVSFISRVIIPRIKIDAMYPDMKKGGAEEYTISVSPVMVHVANSMVLCTDPNIEISVIADIGIVDKIKSVIIDVYKTLLLYHQSHLSQIAAS